MAHLIAVMGAGSTDPGILYTVWLPLVALHFLTIPNWPLPFGPPGRAGSGAQYHSFRFAVRRTSSALSAPKGVSPYKTADNRRRDGISQIRRKWVNQWPYIAAIVTSEHGTAIGWRVTPVSGLQRPYLAIFGPKSTKMADFDGAKSTYRPAR